MKTPKQKKRWIQISLLGVILLISFSFLFVYARDDQKNSIGLSSIHTIASIKIEDDQTEKKAATESETEKAKEASEEKQDKTTDVKRETKNEIGEEKKEQPVSTPEKETSKETSGNKVSETQPVTQPEEKSYATISIDMTNILNHKGGVDPRFQAFIPENGILLGVTNVEIQDGDTAFSILKRVCEEHEIPLNANNGYVRYINNIGEFDAGPNSGWLYKVNGQLPSIGSSSYKINKNDVIEWRFTVQVGDVS